MFRCDLCKKTSKSGEPSATVVVETREVQYPFRAAVHPYRDPETKKRLMLDDPGGVGYETVREVRAHERCAEKFNAGTRT